MGCCSSKSSDFKASRTARWRSTGIVALRDSKLKTFPDEVFELDKSIRTLDLTHNRLVDIPTDIDRLINLQRLILADNIICRMPLHLGKLKNLKVATFDRNQITALPDEMGQLVKLEQLSVSANLLVSLPETIGSLRNLVLLNVSNNKLKSLPESIGSCFSLEELQANDNSIEELPSSICSLVHLKSLNLDNNKLRQVTVPKLLTGIPCHMRIQIISSSSLFLVFSSLEYLHKLNAFSWKKTPSDAANVCCAVLLQWSYLLQKFVVLCWLVNSAMGYQDRSTDRFASPTMQIPPNLLSECKSLQNISLHDNPISMSQFQQMEGFQEFEARRRKKFDKQIDSNVMIGSKALDEGVDL